MMTCTLSSVSHCEFKKSKHTYDVPPVLHFISLPWPHIFKLPVYLHFLLLSSRVANEIGGILISYIVLLITLRSIIRNNTIKVKNNCNCPVCYPIRKVKDKTDQDIMHLSDK